MTDITVDGVGIHYEVFGRGDPILLMHGGMASVDWWKRAGYVDALSGDHSLLLLDFRGHGASARLHDESLYGLRHDVTDAVAVMDAAGMQSATVCGWSWGGTTGLAMAGLHPDRVKAVLAIGSSGRHGSFSDLPPDFGVFPDIAERLEREGMEWVGEEMERNTGKRWLRDEVTRNDAQAMVAWYQAQSAAGPIGCALGDIRQPVLYMPGEFEVDLLAFPDPVLPLEAELRPIPGANHQTAFLSVGVVVPALRALVKGDRQLGGAR